MTQVSQLSIDQDDPTPIYALYWVLFIVEPQIYRVSFLLVVLVLTFLLFPSRRGTLKGVTVFDWLLTGAAVVALGWPLADFGAFIYRATDPTRTDLVLGSLTILLVLEATRRSVRWILPLTAAGFLLYAYAGPQFDRVGLSLLAHRGYDVGRLIGTLYMTLEGIFGVPLDVAATYIVLFTIYGAVLEYSGAGAFFINWSLAAMGRSRSGAGPGRTVTLAGFLLGTVSGSGAATTVMLGSVSWPLLKRAGYKAETANILDGKGDRFFRPADVCVAPDGSLFVADWYDPGVGGHGMGDLDRGRIYRITPKGHKGYTVPAFDTSTAAGAVKALANANEEVRFQAWTSLAKMGEAALPVIREAAEALAASWLRIESRTVSRSTDCANVPSTTSSGDPGKKHSPSAYPLMLPVKR